MINKELRTVFIIPHMYMRDLYDRIDISAAYLYLAKLWLKYQFKLHVAQCKLKVPQLYK